MYFHDHVIVLLLQAAATGAAETLQELILKFEYLSIPRGALINIHNTRGYNMLHYAVMYKRIDCIETLLRLGAGKMSACMGAVCAYMWVTRLWN